VNSILGPAGATWEWQLTSDNTPHSNAEKIIVHLTQPFIFCILICSRQVSSSFVVPSWSQFVLRKYSIPESLDAGRFGHIQPPDRHRIEPQFQLARMSVPIAFNPNCCFDRARPVSQTLVQSCRHTIDYTSFGTSLLRAGSALAFLLQGIDLVDDLLRVSSVAGTESQ
jgi:hypothetical protein